MWKGFSDGAKVRKVILLRCIRLTLCSVALIGQVCHESSLGEVMSAQQKWDNWAKNHLMVDTALCKSLTVGRVYVRDNQPGRQLDRINLTFAMDQVAIKKGSTVSRCHSRTVDARHKL